jgi:deoxyribose-phosphate aldolase
MQVKIKNLTKEQIASVCDHTYLNRPEAFRGRVENPVEARRQEFYKFMEESVRLNPYAVCVRPEDCRNARDFLGKKSEIVIASVVGFPNSNDYPTDFKIAETELAMRYGAKEIDMVLDYERFKQGDTDYIEKDIEAVKNRVAERHGLLKLILETSELSEEEVAEIAKLANDWGVDFIKTSSGFASKGAEAEKVRIMKEHFKKGVKISGGINAENIYMLLEAASGRNDGYIELDPAKIRIGESSLLQKMQ